MSILNSNRPVAHLGRTAQDLSSTHAISMRPAVLRPVVVQDCVPDSAFRINVSDIVRTSALQTAAFLRGKHELDFFFVPYNMVYSFFNDLVLERGDVKSPVFGTDPSALPLMPLEHLYYCASIPYMFLRICRWLNAYGSQFPWFVSFSQSVIASFSALVDLSVDRGDAYAFLTQTLYNELEQVPSDIESMSFVGYDALAMLDTLGFGNFGSTVVSLFDSVESRLTSITGLVASDVASYYNNALVESLRIFFGNAGFDPVRPITSSRSVNPLRLFCYQKIFYDRYRDEIFDNNPLYRYAFSADGTDFSHLIYYPFDISYTADNYPLRTFLRSHTRMVKKDIVSGLYPTSQFGGPADLFDDSSFADDLNLDGYSDRNPNAFNVRYVLAMQKYRETLLRAGSRSKDVLKALFGVESHYINDTYVRYLGSFSGQLDLNKVSCTADTGSYSVGDLAANVFSSLSGDTIEFTCNDYGVIVGVMSFFPQLLHNNFGLSPHVLKNLPLHFFKSQFEDLGLQPVSSSIVSLLSQNPDGSPIYEDFTLGYSARYNEYKQNLDFVHDQFTRHNVNFYCPFVGNPIPVNENDGFNSNYVTVRSTLEDVSISSLRNYLLPDCMDSIFSSLDTGDITNYHFDIIFDCQINAILPMSNLGLPY